jgi:predicted alpha/beta superfamily hydrolase
MFKHFTRICIFAGILLQSAYAQDTVITTINKGKLDSLHSEILQQERLVEVFLPKAWHEGSDEKYDVLYVLDGGNWNTGLINQVQQFLEGQGNIPPTIVVSVMGIDRNHDLTPTSISSWKNSGGADKFIGFFKDELIPFINKKYPSNGDNTLWGHSLGGLYTIYSWLSEPTLFKSYIAVDPSVWWDSLYVLKKASQKLPSFSNMNTTIFVSGREGPDLNGMKVDSLESILRRFAPPSIKWKVMVYPDESHASVRLKTTYDGLKFTYGALSGEVEIQPMRGIIIKGQPIKIWYDGDTANVHYTLDGSLPTLSSPLAHRELTIAEPAKVTYTQFANRERYNRTTSVSFTTGETPAPMKKRSDFKPGGFAYSYYEGEWESWPDIKKMTPLKTGIMNKTFDIDSLPRKKNFALVVDGLIDIKEDGYYIFLLQGDKHSKFYLGNKLLMDWNGNYTNRTSSYIVPLKKGFYPVHVEHLQRNPDFKLAMGYMTPTGMKTHDAELFPLAVQYSR